MRFPRVRFTVRRLIVAVAVVGITLGTYAICRGRAGRFRERAALHRVAYIAMTLGSGDAEGRTSPDRYWWHKALAEQYDVAARHPWLPVALDPPKPE